MSKNTEQNKAWYWSRYSNGDYGIYDANNEQLGADIALVRDRKSEQETLNNTKLIAAAPLMYEALQGCIEELESHEKFARQNGDQCLLDRLNAARYAVSEVKY